MNLNYLKNIYIVRFVYNIGIEFKIRRDADSMDIRQLRYFVTIAEEGQLTRAAKRLHMAQPPLSRQLMLLEEELGVALMDRNGRSMELTEAGKLLHHRAQSLLHQLDQTVTEVKETGEGLRGVLSVGTVISCTPYLTSRIRYFREHYPHVQFKLWEGTPTDLSEHLEKRNIELALVRDLVKMDPFSMIRLPAEPFVLVMPATWNPFLLETHVHMKELEDIPLLLLHGAKERAYHEILLHECRRLGFEPNVVCECPNASVLLALVIGEIGATVLPKNIVSFLPSSNVKVMPILDFPAQSESAVIWLKDRQLSKSALRFLDTFPSE